MQRLKLPTVVPPVVVGRHMQKLAQRRTNVRQVEEEMLVLLVLRRPRKRKWYLQRFRRNGRRRRQCAGCDGLCLHSQRIQNS
jgi:hypothetical protein